MIFGDADDNVGYVFFVKEDLEKAGHFVELSFATRKTTMQNLDKSNDSQMIQTNLILTLLIVDNNDYCHHPRPRIDGEIIEASPTPITICI